MDENSSTLSTFVTDREAMPPTVPINDCVRLREGLFENDPAKAAQISDTVDSLTGY
jgi:hypothetical protein